MTLLMIIMPEHSQRRPKIHHHDVRCKMLEPEIRELRKVYFEQFFTSSYLLKSAIVMKVFPQSLFRVLVPCILRSLVLLQLQVVHEKQILLERILCFVPKFVIFSI